MSTSRARASAAHGVEMLPCGDAACLVRFGRTLSRRAHAQALALLAALDANPPAGLRDLTPAYASLLVQHDPLVTSHEAISQHIRMALAAIGGSGVPSGRLIRIPVRYGGDDGPDLEEVARLTGLAPDWVIALHAGVTYRVYFLGFLAGFPYLGGLPHALAVPRLAAPRPQVPAGSVAIAERQTGIYPVASPGGWRLIGRTGLPLFDPQATPPALLRPGDRVRFIPVRTAAEAGLVDADGVGEAATSPATAAGSADGSPCLRVLRPGPLTTIQDLGRQGYARYGVSAAGAADADALLLGNLLVGNALDAAAIEITLGNCAFEAVAPCAIVLTGADCHAHYDGRPLPTRTVAVLRPGQTLQLEQATRGSRAYLCVAGGVAVPTVLGSRSTDLRSGMGGFHGRALQAGDVLHGGAESGVPPVGRRILVDPERDQSGDGPRTLRVLPGPAGLEKPGMLDALLAEDAVYSVDPLSDRMGVRLEPVASGVNGTWRPLLGGEQLSEGIVRGAVQVPPSGKPIILLADAQTTGGYAVPAVVISADQWRVAQLRPGDRVRFALVTLEEAVAALRRRYDWLRELASASAGTDGSATRAVDLDILGRGFAEWSEAADPTP